MFWSLPSRFRYCAASSSLSPRVRSRSCRSLCIGSRSSSLLLVWCPLTADLMPLTVAGGGSGDAEWLSRDRWRSARACDGELGGFACGAMIRVSTRKVVVCWVCWVCGGAAAHVVVVISLSLLVDSESQPLPRLNNIPITPCSPVCQLGECIVRFGIPQVLRPSRPFRFFPGQR
jgi:hypothetical protein